MGKTRGDRHGGGGGTGKSVNHIQQLKPDLYVVVTTLAILATTDAR